MVKDHPYSLSCEILEDRLFKKIVDIEELKEQDKKLSRFHMIVSPQNQYKNWINKTKSVENEVLKSSACMEDTFSMSAQRKKAAKRRILFCNKGLAG